MIHTEQFLKDWNEHSEIGKVPGTNGVDRQAGTEADREQRHWLSAKLSSYGFRVEYDAIGNQFGLLELCPGAPYVLLGSHLDSQPTAGKYDGAYGVLAAMHACREAKRSFSDGEVSPNYNLAVVNWFNEEGSRFKPSMMGSSVFTGKLGLDDALHTRDQTGDSVGEALTAMGQIGTFSLSNVAAYAEIHVQQGRSMERDGIKIGLVTATWAAHKLEFLVKGEQAHSGAAAMEDRRDALLAAARLIVAARELTDAFEAGILHTACGEIHIYPNSPVVVASEARLLIDLRSPDPEIIAAAYNKLQLAIREIEVSERVSFSITHEHRWSQQPYPSSGVALARQLAASLGLSHAEILTVAGHDSTNMNDVVPTIMLFVPSKDGISHNLNEYTSEADMIDGLRHLTRVAETLAVHGSQWSQWE